MRVTAAFKRLVRLHDVNVTAVEFLPAMVAVTMALRRRLMCPHCAFSTRWRYDTRPVDSRWRHLDLGTLSSSCEPACAGYAAPTTAWWSRPFPSPARGRT